MKIGIVTDTNILELSNDEIHKNVEFVKNTNIYLKYIESLDNTAYKDNLVYIMPDIILEELYNQKLDAFKTRYETFEKKYSEIEYGLKGKLPGANYEKILNKQKDCFLKKIKVVKPKFTVGGFKKTLNSALKKEPPFDKSSEGKKTDAGFKDYMIWKTMEDNDFSEFSDIYFFSGDKIFEENKKTLETKFNSKYTQTKIHIIGVESTSKTRREDSLNYIINTHDFPKTEIIELYNPNLLLQDINSFNTSINNLKYYLRDNRTVNITNINFNDFDNADISIKDITNCENQYIANIEFLTKKYNTDIKFEENEKLLLSGTIEIIYEKDKDNFIKESIKVRDIKIKFNGISLYNNIWHAEFNNYLKNISEALNSFVKYELLDKLNEAKGMENFLEKLGETYLSDNNYYEEKEDAEENEEDDETEEEKE